MELQPEHDKYSFLSPDDLSLIDLPWNPSKIFNISVNASI